MRRLGCGVLIGALCTVMAAACSDDGGDAEPSDAGVEVGHGATR